MDLCTSETIFSQVLRSCTDQLYKAFCRVLLSREDLMVKKNIEKDENRTFAVSASVWRTVIALASSPDLNVLGVNIPLVRTAEIVFPSWIWSI